MKISIEKTFSKLRQFIVLSFILALLLVLQLFMASEQNKKDASLLAQKKLVEQITTLGHDDIDLSIIQFEGKSAQVLHKINKLSIYQFDLIGDHLYNQTLHYENELKKLYSLGQLFRDKAAGWYTKNGGNSKRNKASMLSAQEYFNLQIGVILELQIPIESQRSLYISIIAYMLFFNLLTGVLLFSRNLQKIYTDIKSLYAVDVDTFKHVILTEEVDIISKRMGNRQNAIENSTMIDTDTELLNYKGLIFDFSARKFKSTQIISVLLLQIDHFDALDKEYSLEFINIVIKKIAFIISLFQKNVDLVARIDQQVFAFVLMRKSHEDAVKECEKILSTIEETRFKIPQGKSVPITASGVLILKAPALSLGDTVKQLQDLLPKAAEGDGNRIIHDNRRPKIL